MWTFRKSREPIAKELRRPVFSARFSKLFGFGILLSAVCFLPAVLVLATGWLYNVREVKPNVFVWVSDDVLDLEGDPQFDRAGTAGFAVTNEGVVVIGATNTPFHARELLYEIRHRTELAVRYVINTNSDGDQTLGDEAFTELQATVLCSTKAQEGIRQYRQMLIRRLDDDDGKLRSRMRGFHVAIPTQTFSNDMTLRLGGQEIKLSTLVKNGSSDDSIVYLPAAKVLFLGELFQNSYFPRIESRNLRDWIAALKQVEAWDVDVYVPGHGEPGGKKELAEFRQFLEWLEKEVETRTKEGKSLSQVKREVDSQVENYKWHAPELIPEEVEAVYKQLGKTPPKGAALQPSAQAPLAEERAIRP